jgi:hypothetical protein
MIKKKNSITIHQKMIMIRLKRKRKKRYSFHSFRKIIVQDLDLVHIPFQMKRDLDRGHLKKLIKNIRTKVEAGKIDSHIGLMIENANLRKILTNTISKEIEKAIQIAAGIEKITMIKGRVEIEEIIEIIGIQEATMETTDIGEETETLIETEITSLKNNKSPKKFRCLLKFQCQMREL